MSTNDGIEDAAMAATENRAIKAYINGEFDHPDLVAIGPLSTNPREVIARILGIELPEAKPKHEELPPVPDDIEEAEATEHAAQFENPYTVVLLTEDGGGVTIEHIHAADRLTAYEAALRHKHAEEEPEPEEFPYSYERMRECHVLGCVFPGHIEEV